MDFVAIQGGSWDADAPPAAWAAAREAEGWSGIALSDHFVSDGPGSLHVFAALGAMTSATSTIALSSAFVNNLFRSPVEVAQAALTLQAMSSGRFELGLGAGWLEAELRGAGLAYPPAPERARRFREAVIVVRDLLAGGCRFTGEYYQVSLETTGPKVAPPRLAASLGGPWTLRHIGPLVDHIEIAPMGPALRAGGDFATLGALTREEIRRQIDAARTINPTATVGLSLFVAVGDTPVTRYMARGFAGGAFDRLAAVDARAVAERVLSFADENVDRITLAPPVPRTIEALAPYLLDRAV